MQGQIIIAYNYERLCHSGMALDLLGRFWVYSGYKDQIDPNLFFVI
jgi:hypothetical protein